jgi:hypothetical protein
MRKTDLALLNSWLAKNGPLAKEDLCHLARIKYFTIDKTLRGLRTPTELEQLSISRATGIDREKLFPVIKMKISAS